MRTLSMVLLVGLAMVIGAVLPTGGNAVATEISGTVTNQATGQPLQAAVVILLPQQDTVFTDAAGQFTFEAVPAGTYSLVVTHPDFEKRMHAGIIIASSASRIVNISLIVRSAPTEEPETDGNTGQSRRAQRATVDFQSGAVQTLDQSAPGERKKAADREVGDLSQSVEVKIPQHDYVPEQGSIQYRPNTSIQSLMPVPRRAPKVGIPAPVPPSGYDEAPWYGPFDMYFQDYGTNRFVRVRRDSRSTFAIDVDDASFSVARRYLDDGNLPPTSAIRIEEFVNRFDYDLTPPVDKTFEVHTEMINSPFDDTTMTLMVGIKGRELDRRERIPVNLTFVIDVSGSMGYDNRLELVKYALRELSAQLTSQDRVGIVVYGSGARVVLEPVRGNDGRRIQRALSLLRPGGSTNAEAGLRKGYNMARRQYVPGHSNRIIICSDGVANVGLTRAEDLFEVIQSRARDGITLSSVGVGMGNYNDVLLEKLAKQGNGNYSYVNDYEQAHKVMVEDFLGTVMVLARDVKVQVEFNDRVVHSYRLLGYENRAVEDNRFRDNSRDGGELGPGHSVVALYELVLKNNKRRSEIATVNLRWKDRDGRDVTELNQPVMQDRRRSGDISSTMRTALSAAKLAEMLKGTRYVRDLSYDELYEFASDFRSRERVRDHNDLMRMIEDARDLSGWHTRR